VRALALAALLAALLASCGGAGLENERHGELVYLRGGEGPGRVTVVQRAGAEGPLPIVLFLHGWGATEPRFYAPWIAHLARAGNAVVYPRYQDSIAEPPPQVLGNVLVGMREALGKIDADLDSLVVVGHSAGGALASDYAAIADSVGLPVPRAVLSIYPGRAFRGIRFALPAVDPSRIPAGTRLSVLSGADDGVVDPRDARAIYDGADRARRRFTVVRTPGASDHLAPQRDTAVARRVFWRRLDALIAAARG
jgi:pimeloyl-ACP methyl ester carboxylesterase